MKYIIPQLIIQLFWFVVSLRSTNVKSTNIRSTNGSANDYTKLWLNPHKLHVHVHVLTNDESAVNTIGIDMHVVH